MHEHVRPTIQTDLPADAKLAKVNVADHTGVVLVGLVPGSDGVSWTKRKEESVEFEETFLAVERAFVVESAGTVAYMTLDSR